MYQRIAHLQTTTRTLVTSTYGVGFTARTLDASLSSDGFHFPDKLYLTIPIVFSRTVPRSKRTTGTRDQHGQGRVSARDQHGHGRVGAVVSRERHFEGSPCRTSDAGTHYQPPEIDHSRGRHLAKDGSKKGKCISRSKKGKCISRALRRASAAYHCYPLLGRCRIRAWRDGNRSSLGDFNPLQISKRVFAFRACFPVVFAGLYQAERSHDRQPRQPTGISQGSKRRPATNQPSKPDGTRLTAEGTPPHVPQPQTTLRTLIGKLD